MNRLISSVLLAGVIAATTPLAAFARDRDDDDDYRGRHHRPHCEMVRKCWGGGGYGRHHQRCVWKRVCEFGGHHDRGEYSNRGYEGRHHRD
jgi:hypothetical protein